MKPITPRPADWLDQAPVQVRVERQIDAPTSAVWPHIADHERWSEWFDAVTRIEVIGDASGVGGRRRVVVGPLAFEEEFTEWDPERVFAFTVTAMKPRLFVSLNERVLLTDLGDDRCSVEYRQCFQPRPGVTPLLKVARRQFEKNLRKALDALGERSMAES